MIALESHLKRRMKVGHLLGQGYTPMYEGELEKRTSGARTSLILIKGGASKVFNLSCRCFLWKGGHLLG